MNIIGKAIARLHKSGWKKETFGQDDLGFCILGAIYRETGTLSTVGEMGVTGRDYSLERKLAKEMAAYVDRNSLEGTRFHETQNGAPFRAITNWNDHPNVTQEDVLLVLKKVEADWEEDTA